MSSFIEFQALVLDKLCSIENRLSCIEEELGITPETVITDTQDNNGSDKITEQNLTFKNEINDFQNKLADIKSLLSSSNY